MPRVSVVSTSVAGLALVLVVAPGSGAAGDHALRRCERTIAREGLRYAQELNAKTARCVLALGDCATGPGRRPCVGMEAACAAAASELAASAARLRARVGDACVSVPVAQLAADACAAETVDAFVECLAAGLRGASARTIGHLEPAACALLEAAALGDVLPAELCASDATGEDGGADPPPPTCEGVRACGGPEGLACPEGFACDRRDVLCGEAVTGECVPVPTSCADGAPVCGCGGVTYASDCARVAAGATHAHGGACVPADVACATSADCPAGTFCEWPVGDCGGSWLGTCRPTRRDGCDLCTAFLAGPVCGCDFRTYASDCDRIAAGVAKVWDAPCF